MPPQPSLPPPITPSAWIEAVKEAGANKRRIELCQALTFYADHKTGRHIRPKNATIAQHLGITREAANRGIARLKDDGWLVSTGKSVGGIVVYALSTPQPTTTT